MVEEARDAIIRLGGESVSAKDIVNPNTPLRPGLWKALTDMSGDWDTSLSGWLIEGAPIGVSAEIRPGGWFSTSTVATTDLPVTATGDESREWLGWFIGSADGAYVNYSSAESDPTNTWALLDEERKAGFCTFYDSFDDLAVAVGSRDVIVTKIALATKPNTDPPKYRLICDAKANSLNEVVHCREKIVLPRVSDVVQNIHELMEPARGASDTARDCWSEIEFLAADFQNAFKLIPVQSMEQRFQVCYFQGRWILFHVLMFGVRSSPLVWCRFSSCACRWAQLLYTPPEGRISCFVDDPHITVRGRSSRIRTRLIALPILLWMAIGFPFSFHKFQRGSAVTWIGFQFAVANGSLRVSIPLEKLEAMAKLTSQILGFRRAVSSKLLRRLCGKLCWSGGVIPWVHALLAPMWKALGGKSEEGSQWILIAGIRRSLLWFNTMLTAATTAAGSNPSRLFGREFVPKRRCVSMVITVDASPWGLGGYLSLSDRFGLNRIIAFFSDSISELDTTRFQAKVGDHRFQSLWEALALLVAVRLWRRWLPPAAYFRCRSDSRSAIGAALKLRSRSPNMNMVMAELAWECACDMRVLEMSYSHISGDKNGLADYLSRLPKPGYSFPRPAELSSVIESVCPPRDARFWKLDVHPCVERVS